MKPTLLSVNDRIVLTALEGAGRALSAYEILDKTRSGPLKAPTQVYRALQKLESCGLVHRIEALSAFVACSDAHQDRHSPAFAICKGCGSVREFEATRLLDLAREAAGRFAVETISLELFGRCAECRD